MENESTNAFDRINQQIEFINYVTVAANAVTIGNPEKIVDILVKMNRDIILLKNKVEKLKMK